MEGIYSGIYPSITMLWRVPEYVLDYGDTLERTRVHTRVKWPKQPGLVRGYRRVYLGHPIGHTLVAVVK